MIKILDSFVSDKIAAGEVIERPVSAAKELIENSIDAGASSIIIEIRNGGISYMRITDNGTGISSDEIETAFLRHATSKISTVADLDNINSLGFRGEALASISAVSRLTIISRTADDNTGTKLILHAGKQVSKEKIGANKGTSIIVEDLFYNTPARRKFMKSAAREASAIIELAQHYAIYYSDIRFMMINNGETLFTTAGNGDTNSVIKNLYPDNAHQRLLSVEGDAVSGFISDPGTSISSKKGQLFYVNGRPVSSKIIEKALLDGYMGRVFSGYPLAILFIDVDPFDLDVNIHPGKKEILFLHSDEISNRIKDAVSRAISGEESIPRPDANSRIFNSPNEKERFTEKESITTAETKHTPVYEAETEQTSIKEYLGSMVREEKDDIEYLAGENDIAENSRPFRPFDFSELVLRGYIFNTYIIMESKDSVYMFDQHAAHERIFYEKLMTRYASERIANQPLITSVIINVSPDVYQLKDDILSALTSIGYDISDFGSGSFIIRAIPTYMTVDEATAFAEAFCESSVNEDIKNTETIDKIIMRSCKSAVKGGDRLSDIEITALMKELAECDNPYSCPHGRPTFVKLTLYDIEKIFKRK